MEMSNLSHYLIWLWNKLKLLNDWYMIKKLMIVLESPFCLDSALLIILCENQPFGVWCHGRVPHTCPFRNREHRRSGRSSASSQSDLLALPVSCWMRSPSSCDPCLASGAGTPESATTPNKPYYDVTKQQPTNKNTEECARAHARTHACTHTNIHTTECQTKSASTGHARCSTYF